MQVRSNDLIRRNRAIAWEPSGLRRILSGGDYLPAMRGIPILVGGWLVLASVGLAGVGGRFTQSLVPAEVAACGINRLSAGQAAELDALVRRESAVEASATRPLPAFSHRLSAAEFRAAGLDRLTAAQVARLDDLIERSWAVVEAPAIAPYPAFPGGPRAVPSHVAVDRPRPQVPGDVTLGYGWGGGGSEKFGSMDLNYYDPAYGLGVAVGIGEAITSLPRCSPRAAR